MRISDWSSDVCSSDLLPNEGLCSISTSQWLAGLLGLVPLPCFENSNTSEVLSVKYQTAPLAEDMYINGPIEADVWLSTTAADASLSVRVDDVDENGVAKSLTNGIQTASLRSEEHTSELQSLMRISYAVFCLKKKKTMTNR